MTNQQPQQPQDTNDPNRNLYQQGPLSIEGVEARDLPDKGRGSLETIPGKELGRKVPNRTGAAPGTGTDVGMAATPDIADLRDHGHRKHN